MFFIFFKISFSVTFSPLSEILWSKSFFRQSQLYHMNNQKIIDGFLHNRKKIILTVYEQLFPKVKKWIFSYHGDEDDARNVIWKAFAVFRQKCKDSNFSPDNPQGFIVKTVRYLWFQEIRKRRKDMMTHHLNYKEIEEESVIVKSKMDIEMRSDQEEIIHQFQLYLKKLPILCQQFIRLKYQYGLPHEDIAARYNITSASSRKRLSRCLEQLADIIEQKGLTTELANYYPGVVDYVQKYLKKKK